MYTMKKLFVLLLALVMVLSLTIPAMATSVVGPTTYAITLKDKMIGHNYQAYQIFSGDYHDKTLSNVQWGANFNAEKAGDFVKELKENAVLNSHITEKTVLETAADVAMWMADMKLSFDEEEAQAFADVLHMKGENGAYLFLKGEPWIASGPKTENDPKDEEGKYSYIFNVPGGYYLIKDADGSQENKHDFYTRLILQVSNNVSISTKGAVPYVEKQVHNTVDGTYREGVDVSLLDTVYFKLAGTLPGNYDKYEEYTYIFVDDMTPSLDLVLDQTNNIKTAIVQAFIEHNDGSKTPIDMNRLIMASDENDTSGDKDLYISYSDVMAEGTQTVTAHQLKIKFFDLKRTFPGLLTDDKIVIKYGAKLNDKAVIGLGSGGNGNENKVALLYSNNPQGQGMGKTVEDNAKVYTYELQIHKVDDSGVHMELANAEFLLVNRVNHSGTVIQESIDGAVVDNVYDYKYPTFKKDEEHNTYVLNGWLVTDVPIYNYVVETKEEDGTQKPTGRLLAVDANGKTVKDKQTNEVADLKGMLMISQAGKPIKFQALDAGTYWLRELRAPAGYNLLKSAVSVEISATLNETTGKLTSIITRVNGKESVGDVVNGVAPATIVNTGGAVLPSTGGIGTTIFYVMGSLMAVAAIVLLITKKRMSDN